LAPHVIVLFGATGDLAKRKLLPGLAFRVNALLSSRLRAQGCSSGRVGTV
jgi:glucose-6-phosphate 1-dehydrogenase